MSGTIGLATTPFTDAERADVRRFCGYQAYGAGNSGFQGWRFFQAYGTMEYRLTNLAPAEFQVVRGYLAQLYKLETAIPSASDNLDTAKAAVWTHNQAEVDDRFALYNRWRRELCNVIGIPPGEGLTAGGGMILVV